MRVLVLGGTHYVGRYVVEAALARGDEVSALNRGLSGPAPTGCEPITADRTDQRALRRAIGGRKWDAVIDTWMGAPRVVGDGCALLADRAGHYGYVSSWSVYKPPVPHGADEAAEVIPGDPGDDTVGDYSTAKRGGELAVLRAFGGRALIARPGPMFGPYEDAGTLTWWLRRIRRGGRVLAPGQPSAPFQYVDVRDHATWMLNAADNGITGTFTTVCARGRYTIGDFLQTLRSVTGSAAELAWVPDDVLVANAVRPNLDIPLWLPPVRRSGFNDVDASAAHRAGLDTSRPLAQTLADAWSWLEREGEPPWRANFPDRGLDPAKERRLLDQATR